MKLYTFPASPNARKAAIVAAHLGVPLEPVIVDLTKKESHTPKFLALNPNGKIPVLVDGDFVLWESNAIIQYIAGKKPNSLWPDDARTRADITRWQCWQLAQWMEGVGALTRENLLKPMLMKMEPDPEQVKRGEEAFRRDAAVLDAHLARHSYLVNDALTLADIAVGTYLMYAVPAKMPIGSYKNLQAWFARIEALPAWQQTAPKR
jgi:glutathione S-transferase